MNSHNTRQRTEDSNPADPIKTSIQCSFPDIICNIDTKEPNKLQFGKFYKRLLTIDIDIKLFRYC